MIAGGWPGDSSFLELTGQKVDLTFYYSGSYPGSPEAVSLASTTSHAFTPIIQSPRGHLTFLYPRLRQALDGLQPDVIHVVSEPWGLLCVQAARWVRANPQSRLVIHGCDTIWHHGGALEQRARKILLRSTMGVVAAYCAENSKALALAAQNGLSASSIRARIHTCPRNDSLWRPPQPVERARARAALNLPDDVFAVGMLGRLVPQKGVLMFLDAAEALFQRDFPARFFVAGDGPLKEEVIRRRSDYVVPLNSLPHPHGVLQFLHALDLLCCPSLSTRSWEDQGPRSVLEAMMCGCIPVATPTGGISEMLAGHGVLSQSVDSTSFADAIVEAAVSARDQEVRHDISIWAGAQYSDRAVAQQLVDLWHRVAAMQQEATATEGLSGTSTKRRIGRLRWIGSRLAWNHLADVRATPKVAKHTTQKSTRQPK